MWIKVIQKWTDGEVKIRVQTKKEASERPESMRKWDDLTD